MRNVFYSTCAFLIMTTILPADEGMWLLNEPPRELLKKKYKFDLTDDFLEQAMHASVRFNNGGSGGFVSPEGLVVTNHHIGAGALQKLSTKDRNLLATGFHAATRKDELKCPDLELNVLQEIIDVTKQVKDAVKSGSTTTEAFEARRAAISAIEKESFEKTGLRSDVVTLYKGGLYHLYRFKKYTDVRLVFAPEEGIAFFGGDTDNFEYPRYCLDVCFFRVYENDKPAVVKHWFQWSRKGPVEGDLVFVTGHPGRTQRLETLAKLVYRRDTYLPYLLDRVRTLEAALSQFSEQGPNQARLARTDLHRVSNARKAYTGMYRGLLTEAVMKRKEAEEQRLKKSFSGKSDPWTKIAKAQEWLVENGKLYFLLEEQHAFYSNTFDIARDIVRLTEEVKKPNGERLREYRDSNLESLKFRLFSPAPIHPEVEQAKLAASLSFLAENLGGGHPAVKKILKGKSPPERAQELVQGSRLGDPEVRKKLVEGGEEAVGKSDDTMIQLALLIDAQSRQLRKRYESKVDEVERQAYEKIADARFKLLGKNVAPDATFTLRLAFGVVRGYKEEGKEIPFTTTMSGAFQRAENQQHTDPFVLPKSWMKAEKKLDGKAPLNFASTADTIGGNSGSPVLNRNGELVGINFDRNRHGLVRNFVYTDVQARHVSVHGLGVLEALRNVYGAKALVKEILQSR